MDEILRLSWSKPLAMNPSCSAMAADGSMVRRLYLSIYNWVAFIGWAQVLCYMILALLDKGHEAVYAAIERALLFTQTAAILEVLGELEIERVGEVSSVFYSPTNYWKVTRYSFYGMKESFGFTPSWLLWLRYSTFIACFPVGVVSEICLAYTVLPFMKASEKYCLRMPNKWNFSFNYFYANYPPWRAGERLSLAQPCCPHSLPPPLLFEPMAP
uniref:Very-long-chain (3R)-3-hydroxyacyl-CoA dehydratase n=1 Tax=Oryza nivara TaxID=4536 RepID=A0A0E0FG96_ORYNI